MREGGKQIRLVDDVTDGLPRRNHAGPPSHRWNAQGTFEVVTFTAAVERLGHARRAIVRKWAVVSHYDDERVLRDAESFQLSHQAADPGVEPHEGLLRQRTIGSQPVRKAEDGSLDGPVVDIERLFCRRILSNKFNRPLLHLWVLFVVVVKIWRSAPFTHGAALRALQREYVTRWTPTLIDIIGILAEHLRKHHSGCQ